MNSNGAQAADFIKVLYATLQAANLTSQVGIGVLRVRGMGEPSQHAQRHQVGGRGVDAGDGDIAHLHGRVQLAHEHEGARLALGAMRPERRVDDGVVQLRRRRRGLHVGPTTSTAP